MVILCPRKDIEQLVKAIITLLENHRLQKEMGSRNLQIANDRADWERNFDILEDIYKKLAAAY